MTIALLLIAGVATITFGQEQPDPSMLISTQREAMNRFAMLDGVWRGTAWVMLPSGEKHQLTLLCTGTGLRLQYCSY